MERRMSFEMRRIVSKLEYFSARWTGRFNIEDAIALRLTRCQLFAGEALFFILQIHHTIGPNAQEARRGSMGGNVRF